MGDLPKGKTTLFNYLAEKHEPIQKNLDKAFSTAEEKKRPFFLPERGSYTNFSSLDEVELLAPLLQALKKEGVGEVQAARTALNLEDHVQRKVWKAAQQCPQRLDLKTHYRNAENSGFQKKDNSGEPKISSVHIPSTIKPFKNLKL
ncbi:MAG: hypothetical protein K9G62_08925 [Alphaproteobacteria bacterium]|nr:hypothetical protein [Alphaproteobacteria bacterium]